MNARQIVDSLLSETTHHHRQASADLDADRLDEIAATIAAELENGSGHWDLGLDQYVDERMGDLDWEGGGTFDEDSWEEAYARAKEYVMSKLPNKAAATHAQNRPQNRG